MPKQIEFLSCAAVFFLSFTGKVESEFFQFASQRNCCLLELVDFLSGRNTDLLQGFVVVETQLLELAAKFLRGRTQLLVFAGSFRHHFLYRDLLFELCRLEFGPQGLHKGLKLGQPAGPLSCLLLDGFVLVELHLLQLFAQLLRQQAQLMHFLSGLDDGRLHGLCPVIPGLFELGAQGIDRLAQPTGFRPGIRLDAVLGTDR